MAKGYPHIHSGLRDAPEGLEESDASPYTRVQGGTYPLFPLEIIVHDLGKLIGICIASPTIKELIIQQAHSSKQISASFSVMLLAPTGRFKSTFMNAAADIQNEHIRLRDRIKVLSQVSMAGLVGSIDKNKSQFVPGEVWRAENKVLLLDEFIWADHINPWLPLLQILDSGIGKHHYTRKLGVFCDPLHKRKGDLHLDVEEGQISMDVRIACLIATMRSVDYINSTEFRALINRLTPYRYDLSEDDIDKFIAGDVEPKISHYSPDPKVTISKREYRGIIRFVRDVMNVYPASSFTKKANRARAVEDICRIRAVTGEEDSDFEAKVIGWKLSTYDRIGLACKKTKGK
jgi:hypothetical protein